MAFDRAGFSTLSPGKAGINSFIYKTADTEATLEAANYFDEIATTLAAGDLITAKMSASFKVYEVASITAGVVVVGERLSLAAPETAIADYVITWTANEPTAGDTATIADGDTPTVAETGQAIADLTAKLNLALAALRTLGGIAP